MAGQLRRIKINLWHLLTSYLRVLFACLLSPQHLPEIELYTAGQRHAAVLNASQTRCCLKSS